MKPEDVRAALGDLPHMTLAQGRKLHGFIVEHRLHDCLELGFYHGVSSAYTAAALHELGAGRLRAVDALYASTLSPDIGATLDKVGLRSRVDFFFEPRSYTWHLMRMLEADPTPRFDFCYIDGAHTWDDDGFAFFLVERLLRPGGWILLDDLDWSFASSPTLRETDRVRALPREERETAQVRKVYELLVKPHPGFDRFIEDGDWAFARKSSAAPGAAPATRREEVLVRPRLLPSLGDAARRVAAEVRARTRR